MTESVKLEPCPSGHAVSDIGFDDEFEAHVIRCMECNWRTWGHTEAQAIAAWNTRHQPQEREAVLEEALSQHGLVLTDDPDFDHNEQTFEKAKASFVAALTTPAPAVSQPEREAVAWRWRYKGEGDHPWILGSADPHYPGDSWETQPLYTALTTPAPAVTGEASLEPTTDEVANIINVVTDLMEGDALDKALPEVFDRLIAYARRVSLPPAVSTDEIVAVLGDAADYLTGDAGAWETGAEHSTRREYLMHSAKLRRDVAERARTILSRLRGEQ